MKNNDFYYTIWRKQRDLTLEDVSQNINISIASLCKFERNKLKNQKAYEAIKEKYVNFIKQYEMSEGNAK